MIDLKQYEFWFLVGSQYLYGLETLKKVEQQASRIVEALNNDPIFPSKIVLKPVLKIPPRSERSSKRQMQNQNAPVSSCGCTRSHLRRCG